MVSHNTGNTETRGHPTTVGGLLIVAASIVLSTVAHGLLADTMRIHYRWTVGTYTHYGPEYAPTLTVLVAFPIMVIGLYISAHWLGSYLAHLDEYAELRPIYQITVLAALTMILVVQIAIIALNLWYP